MKERITVWAARFLSLALCCLLSFGLLHVPSASASEGTTRLAIPPGEQNTIELQWLGAPPNYFLDVQLSGTANGTSVIAFPGNGTPNQRWVVGRASMGVCDRVLSILDTHNPDSFLALAVNAQNQLIVRTVGIFEKPTYDLQWQFVNGRLASCNEPNSVIVPIEATGPTGNRIFHLSLEQPQIFVTASLGS
ncbi:hypothetical protein [Cylindrospermum sp. FACHB-282]|uniref:hypothetical protein n=1 Tax=Cylindrospermum sp. FACHB-282 TaxID=2692794 RepID=UPI00168789B3|nr:hypothetical protein [Cylindrospermum sp. FACHB-282]MBD2387116.1 hypothetical protein [Cylindrospermum sp. FACHB-282]